MSVVVINIKIINHYDTHTMSKNTVQELLDCFHYVDLCERCGLMCHRHDPQLNMEFRGRFKNIIESYSLDRLNGALNEIKFPYKLVEIIRDKEWKYSRGVSSRPILLPQKGRFIKDDDSLYQSNDITGSVDPCAIYEKTEESYQILYDKYPERYFAGYEEVEVDEPILQSYSTTTNEDYKEPVTRTRTVTERVAVNKPVVKRETMRVWNSWSKQMEDRVYEQRWTETTYETKTKEVPYTDYVTKSRPVPSSGQQQIGTRRVTKQEPIYKMGTRTVPRRIPKYLFTTHLFFWVSCEEAAKKRCSDCECKECLGWTGALWKWLSCSGRR